MPKQCLIYEKLNNVSSMSVRKTDEGLLQLTGVFGVCGVRNNNNRVYEMANYSAMVNEMKSRIQSEGCPGELEHPNSMNITLENVSHKIDDINIDEKGVVTGTITLLKTPKGEIARAIVEGGLPLFISSRANGNVDKNGTVKLESIKTYDLVGTPGFSQARLNIKENQMCESINENLFIISENEINQKENNMDIEERLLELEESLNSLQEENTKMRRQLNECNNFISKMGSVENLCEGIEKWAVEEFAPQIEGWITEEFAPEYSSNNGISEARLQTVKREILENVGNNVEKWTVEEFAPEIEKWIVESYSPEIEKWVVESYSSEIEKWIVESYSPEIEKWVCEEYSNGLQGWITEEFAGKIQDWIIEEYSPEIDNWVTESRKENNKVSLSSIDETLQLLENVQAQKPVINRNSNIINEDITPGAPKFLREMPLSVRPKWEMASQEIRESISRRSKIYDFSKEGSIEKFWESVSFDKPVEAKNIYEGLGNIANEWEQQMRLKLRNSRLNR